MLGFCVVGLSLNIRSSEERIEAEGTGSDIAAMLF